MKKDRAKPGDKETQPAGGIGWGEHLRRLRLARGLTLEQLARKARCTRGYLSSIENGKRAVPGEAIVSLLEHALSVPGGSLARAAGWERTPAHVRREVMQLAAREAVQREREKKLATLLAGSAVDEAGRVRGALDEAYRSGELHRMIGVEQEASASEARRSGSDIQGPTSLRFLAREVPLINRVAAGYPTEAFTDLGYPARIADEYVRCPDVDDADAFAARVVGESMLPEYREGDVVVFSPAREVKSGMDCFVRLEPDAETTFKRVFFEDGGMIRLQPLNAAYAARVVEREMVAGLYAAVSVIKKVG